MSDDPDGTDETSDPDESPDRRIVYLGGHGPVVEVLTERLGAEVAVEPTPENAVEMAADAVGMVVDTAAVNELVEVVGRAIAAADDGAGDAGVVDEIESESTPAGPSFPVLLVVDDPAEVAVGEAIEAGATDYVVRVAARDRPSATVERVRNAIARHCGGDSVVVGTDREGELTIAQYRSLFDAVDDLVFVTDTDARLQVVNEAFAEFVGEPAGDLVGQPVDDYLDEEWVETGRELVEEMREEAGTDRPSRRFEYQTDDGSYFETSVTPLFEDGEFGGVASVVREVTERREREAELKRRTERLDQFASVVSHDLRNPLNVIDGRLQLAAETGDFDHVDAARDAVERMEAMIDDLLSLARRGRRVEDPEPVPLADVVEESWSNVDTGTAALANTLDGDVTVMADEQRLAELLENLFRNAVEHGTDDELDGEGGPGSGPGVEPGDAVKFAGPSVSVTVGTTDDGFYVADDGPGIPEDERDDVFDHGYTTADDGTGFGLSIVAEIANAHGWSVRASESDDGGARFDVVTERGEAVGDGGADEDEDEDEDET